MFYLFIFIHLRIGEYLWTENYTIEALVSRLEIMGGKKKCQKILIEEEVISILKINNRHKRLSASPTFFDVLF